MLFRSRPAPAEGIASSLDAIERSSGVSDVVLDVASDASDPALEPEAFSLPAGPGYRVPLDHVPWLPPFGDPAAEGLDRADR